jgi:hypothetical protein
VLASFRFRFAAVSKISSSFFLSMKRKRFSKAKVRPKRSGRIVTRMGKKWSKDPAPFWHKSELQTRIQSYKLGVGWGIQKCPRKQNKTIVREPVLFLSKYRTDVDSTKIVTRMLVTPIQGSHCTEGQRHNRNSHTKLFRLHADVCCLHFSLSRRG